ncbi:MAG: hypothetical protein GY757_60935 [bacterium]|nr:hypothetical protein [bacterium]
MIFFTVGTHEQPFDRAVEAIDRLRGEGIISQDVFIQTGYSTYKPRHCEFADFIGFDDMLKKMAEAEIVFTHGGTGSVMLVLYNKKVPVVIPRQKKYDEHIDDHQVHFCKLMVSKGKIIAAYEKEELHSIIKNYPRLVGELQGAGVSSDSLELSERAGIFAGKLAAICQKL